MRTLPVPSSLLQPVLPRRPWQAILCPTTGPLHGLCALCTVLWRVLRARLLLRQAPRTARWWQQPPLRARCSRPLTPCVGKGHCSLTCLLSDPGSRRTTAWSCLQLGQDCHHRRRWRKGRSALGSPGSGKNRQAWAALPHVAQASRLTVPLVSGHVVPRLADPVSDRPPDTAQRVQAGCAWDTGLSTSRPGRTRDASGSLLGHPRAGVRCPGPDHRPQLGPSRQEGCRARSEAGPVLKPRRPP